MLSVLLFPEHLVPVTNLRKWSRSSALQQFLINVWSIWNTLLTFLSSEAGKYRQLATGSILTMHSSNIFGFLCISSSKTRIEKPLLNWSRIAFFFTRMLCSIRDCWTLSLLSAWKKTIFVLAGYLWLSKLFTTTGYILWQALWGGHTAWLPVISQHLYSFFKTASFHS